MPYFDGTGPRWGGGPCAGWGMGPCGYGRGRGYGQGYGRRFFSRKEESSILQDEATELEQELKAVKERLNEIKGQE